MIPKFVGCVHDFIFIDFQDVTLCTYCITKATGSDLSYICKYNPPTKCDHYSSIKDGKCSDCTGDIPIETTQTDVYEDM